MTTERLAPDGILDSSNVTGATVANLDDDPDAPDANWAVATSNNVDTLVRVSFPTPANPLTPGAGLQEFRAAVRKNSASGTGTPTARCELWQAGVQITVGPDINVTAGSGSSQVISFTFDASGLAGADIECLVFGLHVSGLITSRASVDIGAIEWNAAEVAPITGTAAQTLPAFTQSATGTWTVPVFTGTAAQTLPAFTQSATGIVPTAGYAMGYTDGYPPPVRALAGAQTLPAFTQSATGTTTAPTGVTGTAAQTLPAFTQSATGTRTVPVFTGTAAQTLRPFTQSATGATGIPATTGTASQVLPAFTQSATGTRTVPVFTGICAQTLPALTQAATGSAPPDRIIIPVVTLAGRTLVATLAVPPERTAAVTARRRTATVEAQP